MGLSELLCAAVLSIGMTNADTACKHMPLLVEESQRWNVKPEVMIGLIHVESRWNPEVTSSANACGLTQVIPKWTGGRSTRGRKYTCKELYNPVTSIKAGTEIFSYWRRTYGRGNYTVGLCGYNAGYRCRPNAKTGRVAPHPKGMRYAKLVLRQSRKIKRAAQRISRGDRANVPNK